MLLYRVFAGELQVLKKVVTMRPDEAEVAEILKENTYPNLDLAYEEAKRILDFQFGQIDGLDAKASVLIASSGVLITIFLTAASSNMFRASDSLTVGGVTIAFLGALMSAIFAVIAFHVKTYSNAPSIKSLIEKYLGWEDEKNAKYHLLFEYKRMFDHNFEMIQPKTQRIRFSLYSFEVSIAISVLVFFYQVIKGVWS